MRAPRGHNEAMKSATFLLVITCAAPVLAQSQVTEIRATGSHRMTDGETAESSRQLALVDAQRKVWRTAVTELQSRRDVNALHLKPEQLEAYTVVLLETEELPSSSSGSAASPVQQVTVRAAMNPADLIHRMAALDKDQDATFDLVAAWTEMKQLEDGRAFSVRLLAARASAALARTAPSTIGGRAPSAEGRVLARQLVDAALALSPDSPNAHLVMGDLLVDAEQPEDAETEYRKALVGRSGFSEGHKRLAEALRLQGKLDEAEAELGEVLRLDPASARAHSDLALVLRGQGRDPDAIAEYQEAIRLDPDLIDAHNNLAIMRASQGQMEDAIVGFREMIRIDPDSASAYFNLATVLADMDRDVESAAALREVIRINPDHYNARYNLGELLRLEGKFDESATQFAEYLRLAPSDVPANRRNIERAKQFVEQFTNR